MKTVKLGVASWDAVSRRATGAFKGSSQGSHIDFATPELLFRVLTTKRWDIIRTMAGAGPLAIREVARRVNRDVKAVHGDVQVLLNAGILQRTESGRVEFPFDAVRVDVLLTAA